MPLSVSVDVGMLWVSTVLRNSFSAMSPVMRRWAVTDSAKRQWWSSQYRVSMWLPLGSWRLNWQCCREALWRVVRAGREGARDRILLRVIGSPDRYGKYTDGMGGATSSTSKVVILSKSARADCDIDYLFGQVAIDQPLIDWSGNCGNLSAAVGPFAISTGLVGVPADGTATVRIWQANIRKKIVCHVPISGGEVQEQLGDFRLDGVTFPAAEVELEFL
jgi:hypothetical protein